METDFRNINFAFSLAFIMRFKANRKWSIVWSGYSQFTREKLWEQAWDDNFVCNFLFVCCFCLFLVISVYFNKKTNDINKEKYLNVLLTKQSSSGLNKDFRVVDNSMYTYEQIRDGFSYFYPKGKVLEGGVTTMPLEI